MKSNFTHSTRLFSIFLLFFLSLTTVSLSQIGAGVAPINTPSGGFNIDGTLIANTAAGDWVDGTGTGGFILNNSGGPLNTGTTYHLYDPYNTSLDNIFGGGDKVGDNPNSWSWTPGTANDKTDMNNALIHLTTDANGNVWVIFAADRLSNSGNAYVDFEFLQTPMSKTATGFATSAPASTGGRTLGDFLLTVYFENGVAKFDIQRWELVGGIWEYKTYFSSLPLNSVFAAGNTSNIPVPYQAFGVNSYLQNTFIESAVNLTAVLGAIDPCTSLKIKTVFVKSKTSTSSSAAIKDFFNPVAIDNLTLGSSDAGDDATVCSGLPYTLQGSAIPSNGYQVISKTWSLISGIATIDNPNNLNSNVTITGNSATFRLTVVTGPISGSGSQCTVTDDVIISVSPPLTCSISGSDGPLCPLSTSNIYSAPISANYSWSISGNGTIVGNSNSQSVSVTAGSGCNETFLLTLVITDANGCISTCTKTITVIDNTAPVVTTTAGSLNQTLQCNNTADITAALALSPAATDNCTLAPTKNLVSDVTTADANCANAYVRVRTWNFTDGCGNTSANFVQTITVIDNTAPVVTTTTGSLNQTLQCNNTADITAALALSPAATDNCTLTPTKNLVSDVTTADANCANAYVRVRTWNFTDGCGNTSANFVQTITVIDNTAPVVTTTAGSLNQTLQCNNTVDITAALALSPAATDNCTLAPTKNLVSDVTTADANCANAYVRVRTWNFTDGCGNTSANFVQTITVIDNTAPIVTTTAGSLNQTLQCNNTADITAALALSPAATDNCTLAPTKNLVSDVTTADANCANAYVRVRTWNFTDGCGNTSANFFQTITVIDNTAPVVTTTTGSLNQTLQCNNTADITAALALSPAATDNCTLAPTKNLVSDVTTADANCSNAYVRVRTWNFTDGCGNTSANFVQTITVIDNTAPVVTTTAGSLNQTLQCNNTADITTALALSPAATDNCTLAPTKNLVSDVTTADANCSNAYVRVRTWNFTDGCGNTSANFVQTITVIDNTAPVVTTTAGSLNQTLQCNNTADITAALALSPAATDNCTLTPNKVLVSDVTTADANCTNAYVRVRTWNFTDGCGNTSANFVQTITVIDNTAPVVTTTAASLNQTLQCNNTEGITAALALSPAATDNCTLTPNKVLVSDVTTADANCTNAYTRVRTWNFTDGCGNTSANFVQTITVIDNTAPVVTTTAASLNQTLQCNNTEGITAALALSPAATDNCTLAPTKVLVSDVTTADANCTNAYVRVRTWNFTDGCGNTSTNFVQTITVIDNTAPVVTTTTASLNQTLQCNNTEGITAALALSPAATDNCTLAPTKVLVSDVTTADANCTNAYTRVRTWNFTDGCGNTSANFVQTITVIDNSAPTFTTPADITISSDENCLADISTSSTGTVTNIQDNCDSNPLATYVDSECFGSFDEQEINAGNGNYFPFTISGFDNLTAANIEKISLAFETNQGKGRAEFILVAPSGQAIKLVGPYCEGGECDDESSNTQELYLPVFYPNSSGYTKWNNNDFIQDGINQNLIPNGETTSSNNIIGVSSFVSSFEEFTGSMNGNWFIYSKKQANVNGSVKFKSVCLKPTSLCVGNKVISRTWTVADACGNKTTSTQTIKIIDTSSPTWITTATALNTSIECNNPEALAAAQSLNPIAKDNCDMDVTNITKVVGEFLASSECANAGTYTNTWTVSDDCGNTSEVFTQVITIQDTTAPTWSTQATALNTTVECSDTEALATAQASFPTASDLCDADVTNINKVSGEFVASSECANAGTYTNTWTVSDDCGNTSEVFTQVITIQDTTAPTWSTQATTLNTTVECSDTEALTIAQAAFPTATDLCDSNVANINKVSGEFVASSECANAGTYTNTWTVNDDCGNTSEVFTQVITVQDTTAPTWSTQATALNTTVECSDTEALATAQASFPTASDLCDADVTNINKVSGEFVASSECANAGTYTNTWTVSDDCGNTSEVFTQVITIQDTTAPTWSTQATTLNTTVECSDTEALAIAQAAFPTATDLCDSNVANINKVSGEFVASSECANAGTYTNTWTVSDDCGNTSEVFTQVITIQDKTDPIITTAASNITVECDSEGNQNAITTWLANNGGATASDNCSDVTWSNNFSTLSNDCSTAVTVIFTAKDACGNSSSTSATFSVKDTTAPIAPEAPITVTVACATDVPAIISLTATDNCSGEITTEGVDVITPGECLNSFVITRTWTFTDACSNSSSTSQTINVIDTVAPVINQLPEMSTISCPATPEFTPAIATDNCGSTVTLTFADTTTNSACAGAYSVTRTWTATDACGNTANASQTINVQDTAAPVIAELPSASTISCPATPEFTQAIATDNCGSTVTLTFVDTTTSGACAGAYSVTRTWTATDACGNTANASQTINVQDTAAPIIAELPSASTISCPATPEFTQAIATDGCGSTVILTFVDTTTSGACAGSYSVTRTWTATDACGNTANASQTINVQDTAAPVIAELPSASTISCPATLEFTQAIATDGCGSTVTLTFVDTTTSGACAGAYSVTRTWTAIDACGNTANASQTINVQDTAAPVIAELPSASTISCPAIPEFTQAIATDGCGSTVTLTFVDTTTNGACAGAYSVTRTWTATDACGNTANASQTINVIDTVGPTTATPFNSTVNINCDAIPTKPELVFVDNCSSVSPAIFTENIINRTENSYSIVRKWSVSDTCGNASEFTQIINVTIPNSVVTINSSICNDGETTTTNLNDLLPVGTATGTWVDVNNSGGLQGSILNAGGLSVRDYTFEYKINDANCPRTIRIIMTVNTDCGGIVLACGTVLVHNAFSPNGDGINEKFIIDNIDDTVCYPDNTVEIYNRWGVLVFETKGYNNTSNAFDGISGGRSTVQQSSGLPTGTYFYILNYTSVDNDGKIISNKKDGYLYLTK
ncbi:gliding motility-associated C-terminal domain-containing protein [Flavobacterium sp. KS-LB2]|uniref:HYR-like domain-containing protein n=1 Tax=Flavobacterium sp. KS-LB2 TaxID=3120525 RepID=UPI0030D4F889